MDKFTEDLTFRDLSTVSLKRATRWHNGSLAQWSVLEWAGAAAGEMGEAANVAKKIRRLDLHISQRAVMEYGGAPDEVRQRLVAHLAREIAGTVIYLDLMAQREGIDLVTAIREEFNAISEREGFPERL